MSNELVKAMGSAFELVKAFMHALERNGGRSLASYLKSEDLQDEVARMIIGGPWKIHDTRLEVEMDWSKTLKDMSRDMPSVIRENLFLHRGSESIFEDRHVERPTEGKACCQYVFIHCPRIKVEEVGEWFERLPHRSKLEWTDEREVAAFGHKHFPFPEFELLTAGVKARSEKSPDGLFPSFGYGKLGWHGFNAGEELPDGAFFLFRWLGE